MADFNGVTLPDLPEVDRGAYPYAWVGCWNLGTFSMYILLFTSSKLGYSPTNSDLMLLEETNLSTYMYSDNDDAPNYWESNGEGAENSGALLDMSQFTTFWADYDILNSETGEVYFPSSVKPLFYYNGVRLPQLPQELLAEYPNCVLVFFEGIHGVFMTKSPVYNVGYEDGIPFLISLSDETAILYVLGHGVEDELPSSEFTGLPLKMEGYSLIWSSYDMHVFDVATEEVTDEIYLKGTQAYSEEETASITLKTLCDLGDAIREVTGDSTLRKPKEIIAKVKTLIGGVSGGYVVSFYDENEEMLAVHSIKQGNSTNAPNYTCKKWIDTDGNVITFPYTPTEGICFYANSDETFDDVLYEFYDIDKAVYPYVCIVLGGTYNNSCDIFFGKTISTNSTSNITLTGVMYKSANFNLNISDFANIEEVIDLVITNVPKLQERSDWSTGGGEKYYLYANFENNLTNIITKYRLDQ